MSFRFATDDIACQIALGLPEPSSSRFAFSPQIKTETLWQKPPRQPSNVWPERTG